MTWKLPLEGTDGKRVVVASPIQFDGRIGKLPPTPQPGEQTDAILSEFGLDVGTIEHLRSRGIVG